MNMPGRSSLRLGRVAWLVQLSPWSAPLQWQQTGEPTVSHEADAGRVAGRTHDIDVGELIEAAVDVTDDVERAVVVAAVRPQPRAIAMQPTILVSAWSRPTAHGPCGAWRDHVCARATREAMVAWVRASRVRSRTSEKSTGLALATRGFIAIT
jgi:hypothetical protein